MPTDHQSACSCKLDGHIYDVHCPQVRTLAPCHVTEATLFVDGSNHSAVLAALYGFEIAGKRLESLSISGALVISTRRNYRLSHDNDNAPVNHTLQKLMRDLACTCDVMYCSLWFTGALPSSCDRR